MSTTADGPSFLLVWMNDDSQCRVTLADEPVVDAAVQRWVDSARTRDTPLLLTTAGGGPFKVLASHITCWMESTPASRAANDAIDAAVKAESERPWADGE